MRRTKMIAVVFIAAIVIVGVGLAVYFLTKKPPVTPGGAPPPTGAPTFAIMALGGDCTQSCPLTPISQCVRGATSSTFVALSGAGAPVVSLVDGVPIASFNAPGLPASYQFPTTTQATNFLIAVLVVKDPESGQMSAQVGMFNASSPTSGTVYPQGIQNSAPGGDEGAGFAQFVAQALQPRQDGLVNDKLLLALSNGPAFFAQSFARGFPSPGNSAWNVLAAMNSLGDCPVWNGLVAGSRQAYCAAYDFATKKLVESTSAPNCVATLTGTL